MRTKRQTQISFGNDKVLTVVVMLQNKIRQSQREDASNEDGFMLLFVVVLVAILLITLAIAAPRVAADLRRDKEVESMHRQQQYVRAIRMYYKKLGSYPPSMEALEKSNNVRFLRHQYVDPLTGESNWRLIHQGEQQTKTHVYFGEELTGLPTGGLGAAAGLASGGTQGTAAVGPTTVSGGSALSAGFGGATIGGTSGTTGSSGATGSTGTSAFGSGSLGQIVGVGSAKGGESILQPNQQTTYDTWEFWYDPRIEILYKSANPTGGGGLGSQSASSFGKDAVSGQPNSGSGATGSTGATGTTGSIYGSGSTTRP